jgi:hypothetical protein
MKADDHRNALIELSKARRQLAIRSAELRGTEARLAEAERQLQAIRAGTAYRMASTVWRVRARLGTRSVPELVDGVAEASSGALPELDLSYAELRLTRIEAAPPPPDGPPAPEHAIEALLLLGGTTEEKLAAKLDELATGELADKDLLVITDCAAARVPERYGVRYEYIPPLSDWERRLGWDPAGYEPFVRRRLEAIATGLGATLVRVADEPRATP